MNLIRMIPQITSPRATDKEIDEAAFGSTSFHEGWEICEKIFAIIQQCHSISYGWKANCGQCHAQASDIDKLTSFFPTKVEIQNKTDFLASETSSEPWKDNETSDDDYPSLG